ncbi:elongator complex protein 5 isoform X2 [Leptinotarsa decemlineata]|uniref:elongator complex protein 5 isoform X2 n=1 Tax=Leptinotarsa decemlineata TaxID=7539 RepID=UPI003D309901
MLRNYLTTVPYTKFVIIEERGKSLFDFILKIHLDRLRDRIHYFVFQENFSRAKESLGQKNIVLYDFVSNSQGWRADPKSEDFDDVIKKLGPNDVVFIDSLAHVIYHYGLAESYKMFNYLKNQSGIEQIITLLHQDLLLDNLKTKELFHHLSTLSLSLKPNFVTPNKRIQYTFKKLGGKIVNEVEEYWFESDTLMTSKFEKLDSKILLEKEISNDVLPETLTTFKISLTDKEKIARDSLILPYLPKNGDAENRNEEGGRIIYELDEIDDWDEEDPDDDLDI